MGGIYEQNDYSELIKHNHSQWNSNDRFIRKKEDIKACQILNCKYEHFNYFDCMYRKNSNNEFLYRTPGKEFSKIVDEDYILSKNIENEIIKRLDKYTILYVPSGIEHHIDHKIMNQIGKNLLKMGYKVYFYHDFNYEEALSSDYKLHQFIVEKKNLYNKKDAILCYSSQINLLFNDENNFLSWIKNKGGIKNYYIYEGS